MPTETIHFRVEYSNGAVYHIIASTNIDQIENWDTYFPNQTYTERNGLASLFSRSDSAADLDDEEKNIFFQRGTARDAAKQLIEKLNNVNNGKKPLFVTEY